MKNGLIIEDAAICDEYINNSYGTETIAKKYHIGKKRVVDILKRNGVQLKKRGKQPLSYKFIVPDWSIVKYKPIDGYYYVAKEKNGQFVTKDYMNKAGVLTTHIKNEYNIEIPTLYDRRLYYMKTGDYWWEQWFDIVSVEKPKVKKCPYCEWETIDVDNRSGYFEQHLKKVHKVDKQSYLKEFPEEIEYFISVNKQTNLQFETDVSEFVICKVCGKKLRRIDTHHLKTHGITKLEYIQKYGDTNLTAIKFHERQRNISIITNMNSTFKKQSSAEKEIIEFIKSLGVKCGSNRKCLKGREIDIYMPEFNIGIEYDGLYYHTESMGKDKHYHVNKTDECNSVGTWLIHIFEDEYVRKKDIVLSKIKHIIGKDNGKKVYARKCSVKEITKQCSNEFLEKNHIQGKGNSTIALGLFYDNELVAVMTFLNEGNGIWNLTRFASDINKRCIGAGGKMFKHFLRLYNPSQIKTFADRRWTINPKDNLYTSIGFKIDGVLPPEYRYYNRRVDKYKRFHKFGFRKQILHKKYGLPLTMTENEMTKQLGYDRIWDCGLIRYVYINPNYLL